MCYKHSAVLIICMSAIVHSDKYTIQMKDHEFVGDDPVLMRELTRRMRPERDPNAILDPEMKMISPELSLPPVLNTALTALLDHSSKMAQDRGGVALNATSSGNQTNIERQQQDIQPRRSAAYPNDPADKVIKNFAVNMIEQAIYSVQYRLNEIDQYIRKYDQDVRFRMGYIIKLLHRWLGEMLVIHQYISKALRLTWDRYNLYVNLMYHSHLLRKNIDVTYTVYYVLKLYTDYVKKGPPVPGKGERPKPGDMKNIPDSMKKEMEMEMEQEAEQDHE